MSTHITKTWFDGEKVVTQEIPESEVYKQEPVAWMDDFGNAFPLGAVKGAGSWRDDHQRNWKPLYTAPPQRQPLTDEEIKAVIRAGEYDSMEEFARAIERAHGIGGEHD